MGRNIPRPGLGVLELRGGAGSEQSDLGLAQRRLPSPDVYRTRDPLGPPLRRRSPPPRWDSPALRRSPGRSASPFRRNNSAGFHVDNIHADGGRYFGDHQPMAREQMEAEFREHGRFAPPPAHGFARDRPPSMGGSRTCTIHVRNLPNSMSVERIKDDLLDCCLRYGRVMDLVVDFRGSERHAFVTFAEPPMAEVHTSLNPDDPSCSSGSCKRKRGGRSKGGSGGHERTRRGQAGGGGRIETEGEGGAGK